MLKLKPHHYVCSMIIVIGIMVLGGVMTPAMGATTWTQDVFWVREGGVNYQVRFAVPSGEMIEYANNENCGNAAHRTRHGSPRRYFNHFHITYTLPKTGTDDTGQPRTVTTTNVNAYWDNAYNTHTRIGTCDVTYNCWGYSFQFGVWIQDPTYIYADDYITTTTYQNNNRIKENGHVVNIITVNSNKIMLTREKNQYSGIYEKSYAPAGTTTGYPMVKAK